MQVNDSFDEVGEVFYLFEYKASNFKGSLAIALTHKNSQQMDVTVQDYS